MAKCRKKRKKKNLTPRNVLSGKVNVSALELVRMIHRVNPTARDMSGHEAKKRYRLKSEFQSLLINRFGDSLEIQADNPEKSHTAAAG